MEAPVGGNADADFRADEAQQEKGREECVAGPLIFPEVEAEDPLGWCEDTGRVLVHSAIYALHKEMKTP